jgi:cytochrome c-type biogenesis protein
MTTVFDAVKRHYAVIIGAGGAILIVMGVLVYSGELFQLNIEAQKFLDRFGLNIWADV